MNNYMLENLIVGAPTFSFFFWFNLFCTLFIIALCVYRFINNNYITARLSFCFVVFLCLFYQIPLVIFTDQVEKALNHPWTYSLIVNGGAIGITLWGIISRRLDLQLIDEICHAERRLSVYFFFIILSIVCLTIYLSGIPWKCTGLYALIYDPWLTLLARELSVKLLGSSVSTYMLGAYVNAIAPVVILLSVWLVRDALLHRRLLNGIVGFFGGSLATISILISGTKGLLLPSLLMLIIGCYFWGKGWVSRIATILFAMVFVFSTIIFFEIFKERDSLVGAGYDFAACSVEINTCNQSQHLLESLTHRDYSLGLPSNFIKPMNDRLICLCEGEAIGQCPSPILGEMKRAPSLHRTFSYSNALVGRFFVYGEAIFRRVMVVPFQVSVWHYMYAETETIDGVKSLPFARRLTGSSLNMPELVYQKYGSIYSRGDKTSTSTAPTGFFLSYPAYLGFGGLFLAFLLVITLDLILAKISHIINTTWIPILIGTVIIMCINFMVSDFVTVLISHGGVAGIMILLTFMIGFRTNSKQ